MYSFLASKLIYPLGDKIIGTSVMKYYHWLQKTQWWSPKQLQEFQNSRLQLLIKHVVNDVPYYKRLFSDMGISVNDIQNIDDLVKLPILTKKDIRRNPKDMLAMDFKKWKPIPDATGGSTGEPLKYFITKDLASINWAGNFRGWGWGGYKLGDKRIAFGGSSLVPNENPTVFDIARDKLERNLRLSAVSMNVQKYEEYIRRIRMSKSRFIYGYASAVYLLADYCKLNNINDISFDAVFSTAEVLLSEFRETIEQQFKCKVFDEYGSYDGGGQAMECEKHQGFHITAEKVIMEIADENGKRLPPGTPGRVIVTDLNNYAMPFIRYEVGDTGTMSVVPCECGRGLPLLKTLEGRIPDAIKFSNGVILSGAAVPCMLKGRSIKQYQLEQVKDDELLVRIVKDNDYSDTDTRYIQNILEHHCKRGVTVKLVFCSNITTSGNGKYRFILSKK